MEYSKPRLKELSDTDLESTTGTTCVAGVVAVVTVVGAVLAVVLNAMGGVNYTAAVHTNITSITDGSKKC